MTSTENSRTESKSPGSVEPATPENKNSPWTFDAPTSWVITRRSRALLATTCIIFVIILVLAAPANRNNFTVLPSTKSTETAHPQTKSAKTEPQQTKITTAPSPDFPETDTAEAATEGMPPSLPPRAQDIGLADFRQVDGDGRWEEGSYSVAGHEGIQGIGTSLQMNREEATLELRLKNKYQKLKLTVGLDDDKTVNTSLKVNLSVSINNKPQPTVPITFNRETPLEFNVTNANSVLLTFELKEPSTSNEEVYIVLYQTEVG